MGSSPFARHYSGNRGFFPFLRVLRCFSSPACLSLPYGFRQEYARITTRGFPHSEIPGSKVGQHLPRAYRSRPRPSSALGAKASTVCPFSLDSERTRFFAAMEFSRCAWIGVHEKTRPFGRSLKTQQRDAIPVAGSRAGRVEIRRGRRCSRRARGIGRLVACDCWAMPTSFAGQCQQNRAIERARTPAGVRAPASLERR